MEGRDERDRRDFRKSPPSGSARSSTGCSTRSTSTPRSRSRETDAEILAAIDGPDELGILIGRRGQTLDALQLLCYRAASLGVTDRKRVTLDAAGYRERRRALLEEEAVVAAERAARNDEPVRLEPMSASERRMIHEVLKDRSDVEMPLTMVVTVLLFEHALFSPLWERLLFFGRDHAELQLLQNIEERLLTRGDLQQFLETVLAAVRDHLQSPCAFAPALNE